jgi:hypothetical protein
LAALLSDWTQDIESAISAFDAFMRVVFTQILV